MKCEKCNKKHNGVYGSGRFCSEKCARSFSTKKKRDEINKKVSKKLSKYGIGLTKKEFIRVVSSSPSMRKASEELGIPYTSFKRVATTLGIYSTNQGWSKGLKRPEFKITKERFIKEVLIFNGKDYRSQQLKAKLIEFGFKKDRCELCGQGSFWNGQKLTLQVDHKNGNSRDNRLCNLRIICPNCHSQTPNFSGRNAKRVKVSDEILLEAVQKSSNIAEAIKKVGLVSSGRAYKRIQRLLAQDLVEAID